ncbi:SRPBCC domain-containing protein [Planosporangium thailandense]|uniref:SRPBCC domain-containing protein n=1 Tax=Planosporangium thailandense TaxID=765197 RepID=A0ABX0XSQ4_9ACTN|nr:SRPBCC domain-containing protein [Planosporangium thailandense]
MTDRQSIRADQYLAHSPARVWRALTDPQLMASWLMPNDFKPDVGHRFTFHTTPMPKVGFDGIVHCEVLAVEPERMLRISWVGGNLDTTVTWTLVPEGRGTRLFVEHAGFDLDDAAQTFAFQGMGNGWRTGIFRALDKILDEAGAHHPR